MGGIFKAAVSRRGSSTPQSTATSKRGYTYDAFATHATDPDGDLVREVEAALEGYHRRADLPSHLRVELELCVDGRDFVFPRGVRSDDHPARFIETIVRSYQRQCRALLIFSGSLSREHPWVNDEIRWWREERPDGPIYFVLTHGLDPLRAEAIMPPALLELGGPDNPVFFDFRGFYKRSDWASTFRLLDRRRKPREAAMRREAFKWERVRSFQEELTKLAARLVADATDLDLAVSDLEEAYAKAERRRHRRTVAFGAVATAAVVVTAGLAVNNRLSSEMNRLQSDSQRLALIANAVARPDQQLLYGLAGLNAAYTPEARGVMINLLDRWSHLQRLVLIDGDVGALGGHSERSTVVAGTFDGKVAFIESDSALVRRTEQLTVTSGGATAVLPLEGGTIVGRWDGAVDHVGAEGEAVQRLLPPLQAAATEDTRVLAIAAHPTSTVIAIGGADGSLRFLDAVTHKATGRLDLADKIRVNAIAADPDVPRFIVGTGSQDLIVVDVSDPAKPAVVETFPTRQHGEPLALGFAGDGVLTMFAKEGLHARYKLTGDGFLIEGTNDIGTGLVSAAAIDGAAGRIAVGDASGNVAVYDLFGFPLFEPLRGHSTAVQALTFIDDGEALASGAYDGTIALWGLERSEDLSREYERPPGEILDLNVQDGTMSAVLGVTTPLSIWRKEEAQWDQVVDLDAASKLALGSRPQEEQQGANETDFLLPQVALGAFAVAWVTPGGEVLWAPTNELEGAARVLARSAATDLAPPVLGRDGRVVAWINDDGTSVEVFISGSDASRLTMRPVPSKARSIALDNAGERLAIGLETGEIIIYRLGESEPEAVRQIHGSAVEGLIFSQDGEKLVSYGSGGGGADRSIAVSSLPGLSDAQRLETRLPGDSATALATGLASDIIAATDRDGQVLLWSLTDRRFIGTLFAGGSWGHAMVIDDDNQRLWVSNWDGRLVSWDLSREEIGALACRKANRAITPAEWETLRPNDDYASLC